MLFLVAVFCLLLEIRGQGGVVTPIPGVIGNQTSPNLIATCNPGSAGGMNTVRSLESLSGDQGMFHPGGDDPPFS